MPKTPSVREKAFASRKERHHKISSALEWCVKNEKGYQAAVSAGIILDVHKQSLKRALAGLKKKEALEASPLSDAQKKIQVAREDLDGRMV